MRTVIERLRRDASGAALRPPRRWSGGSCRPWVLEPGTIHGARCPGRETETRSLEPGTLAHAALRRRDALGHTGVANSVAALIFGSPRPAKLSRGLAYKSRLPHESTGA